MRATNNHASVPPGGGASSPDSHEDENLSGHKAPPTPPPRPRALGERRVWRRTLVLGLPVGLLQAALNQGDHWWQHDVDAVVVAKTILSPLLSCAIAFASAVATPATQPNVS